ncbi:unnamed protein product [Acanthoscelides obtectus]|uniref:Uncharacterized protein n=1 Tax=Acanthoscelides obtectus TaxID=200917 RepID=A0A9P0K2A5_ACAOB|nr:unnamed protein product [Acanthoscelides obtectus]CAK1627442.1 hypothetical protein AOBTE_LOCUS4604 [Acanthoscelides obtectus]
MTFDQFIVHHANGLCGSRLANVERYSKGLSQEVSKSARAASI